MAFPIGGIPWSVFKAWKCSTLRALRASAPVAQVKESLTAFKERELNEKESPSPSK